MDNTGELITGTTNCDPDFRVVVDGCEFFFDVKNCGDDYKRRGPYRHSMIFKVHPLKHYVEIKACIIVVYNTGFIDKDPSRIDLKNTRWGLIKPRCISNMLAWYEWRCDSRFGKKLCIEIPSDHYHLFFESHELLHVRET